MFTHILRYHWCQLTELSCKLQSSSSAFTICAKTDQLSQKEMVLIYSTSFHLLQWYHALLGFTSFAIGIMSVCIIHKISRQKTIAYRKGVERKDQSRQLTIILLLISISYIILYFPLLIVLKRTLNMWMNRVKYVIIFSETSYISVFAIVFLFVQHGKQVV